MVVLVWFFFARMGLCHLCLSRCRASALWFGGTAYAIRYITGFHAPGHPKAVCMVVFG